MQEMGKKEIEHMEAKILRKIDTGPSMIEKQKWHLYSKRLLKDLEAKGTIRTAVEGWNLSLHACYQDYLGAECVRAFPYGNVASFATVAPRRGGDR